jgi:hypothetical protein
MTIEQLFHQASRRGEPRLTGDDREGTETDEHVMRVRSHVVTAVLVRTRGVTSIRRLVVSRSKVVVLDAVALGEGDWQVVRGALPWALGGR